MLTEPQSLLKACCLVLCTCLPSAPSAAETQSATVVFVDRATNIGSDAVAGFEVRLAAPSDHPGQTLQSCRLLPEPQTIGTDKWGRRVARWHIGDLAPGQTIVRRWIADAVIHPWQVRVDGAEARPLASVAPEIAQLYLADGDKYHLAATRAQADRVAPGNWPVTGLLERLFDHVVARLRYVNDSRWSSADVALSEGTGSCSEYSFSLIALCRARGIPARYVGGTARRSASEFYVDRVWHRWVEAYIPSLGWVPLDPTRSDAPGQRRRYFGRAPDNCLVVSAGDGGAESLLDWQIASYHAWPAATGEVKVARHGWWFGPVPTAVQASVLQWADKLAQAGDARTKRRLLTEARAMRTRFVLPWLDDLLYDKAVRLPAARAMRDIGGNATIVAVAESLERAGDDRGDQQIGRLLDTWAVGERGGSHGAWDAWLGSRAFPAFIAAGEPGQAR